jgi:hypothetical protein
MSWLATLIVCACATTTLVGVSDVGATTKPEAAAAAIPQRLGLRTVFYHTVRKELLKEGLSSKAANCVVGELKDRLTDADFRQIESGKAPKGLRKKASQAGKTCRQRLGSATFA